MAKAGKESAGGEDKAAPASKSGRKAIGAKAPVQQGTTDKFGLSLLVVVLLLTIVAIVIWGKVGVERSSADLMGLFTKSAAEYNQQAAQAKILAYRNTGRFGGDPSLTDSVLINQGRMNGVRLGDVFKPSGGAAPAGGFVEYCVYEVHDVTCLAELKTNLDLTTPSADGATGTGGAGRAIVAYPPETTLLTRAWEGQDIRKLAVKRPAN